MSLAGFSRHLMSAGVLGAVLAISNGCGAIPLQREQAARMPDTAGPGRASMPRPYARAFDGEWSDALAHSALSSCPATAAPAALRRPLRIATWNIRAARSASLEEIAAELSAIDPDLIGLQEVDSFVRRTGFVDQPSTLARALGYQYAFAASVIWDGGDYGLAILSREPLVAVHRHRLESPGAAERRIVLDATACVGGRPVRVFNHHADFRDGARHAGLAELAALARPEVGRGLVVFGDFNEEPSAPGVSSVLGAGLVDVVARHVVPGDRRAAAIDYLLLDEPLARHALAARVWLTSKSDHHALVVDLDW